MKWSTNKIVSDLASKMPGVTITTEQQPQGERYLRDILIEHPEVEGDGVSIIGFDDELDQFSDVDNPTEDVKIVEVRSFSSDSNGGLEKSADKRIRNIYFEAVDYFTSNGITIADNLKNYF